MLPPGRRKKKKGTEASPNPLFGSSMMNADFLSERIPGVNDSDQENLKSEPEKLDGNFYSGQQKKISPEAIKFNDKDKAPDFRDGKILRSFSDSSAVYGPIEIDVVESRDKSLQFLFARDKQGRVWIQKILDTRKAEISGAAGAEIDGGDLTTEAFEVNSQFTDETGGYGNDSLRDGNFVDMYENYISRIPIIREYIDTFHPELKKNKEEQKTNSKTDMQESRTMGEAEAFHGTVEGGEEEVDTTSEREAARYPRIRETTDFKSLYNILREYKTLEGEKRTYDTEELLQAIIQVRKGQFGIDRIPEVAGLRKQVKFLLEVNSVRGRLSLLAKKNYQPPSLEALRKRERSLGDKAA